MFDNKFPYTSYNEYNLDWILQTITELKSSVQQLDQAVSGYLNEANRYTDEQNKLVLEKVDSKLRQLEFDLDKHYSDFVAKINGNIEALDRDFAQLERETAAAVKAAGAYTDTRISQNNDYIFEQIGEQILDVKVLNYFTGEYVTVQEMFDYLAAFHLDSAITIDQIAARSKTVNQMIAFDATCAELAINGGTIIS